MSNYQFATVEIVLGSESDLKNKVRQSDMLKILDSLGVNYQLRVISAHRNPTALQAYCQEALRSCKVGCFIAVMGLMPGLPGAIAAETDGCIPVIGVSLTSDYLHGLEAAKVMISMPTGRPVLSAGIDKFGLENSALAAVQIIAFRSAALFERLRTYQQENRKPAILQVSAYPQEKML